MMCRLIKFVSLFSFCLASNIVVTIAINRTVQSFRLRHAQGANGSQQHKKFTRRILVLAYAFAFTCSLPQLFLFKVAYPFEQFVQCVSVFQLWSYRHSMYNETLPLLFQLQSVYSWYHLLTVFWVPLTMLIICYCVVIARLNLEAHRSNNIEYDEFAQRKLCILLNIFSL